MPPSLNFSTFPLIYFAHHHLLIVCVCHISETLLFLHLCVRCCARFLPFLCKIATRLAILLRAHTRKRHFSFTHTKILVFYVSLFFLCLWKSMKIWKQALLIYFFSLFVYLIYFFTFSYARWNLKPKINLV